MALIFTLLVGPLATMRTLAQGKTSDTGADRTRTDSEKYTGVEVLNTEIDALPGFDYSSFRGSQEAGQLEVVGTDQGSESEPNDTTATADPLSGSDGRIRGLSFSGGPPASVGTDTDFYSFTTTVPNSKIFAATQTNGSGAGQNTNIAVLASDGTTVLESDLDDGSMAGTAGTLAGTVLATPGTYFLRITNGSLTAPIASYELYFAIRSGSPTAEVEPNNSGGTPNPIPASGFMSGAVVPTPAADSDTFGFSANAGDTIAVVVDLDPERDNVQWNGRIGVGTFGTPANILVVNDASTGSATNPLSEAFFIQVKSAGTFFVYVDEPAGGGSATATYNMSITTIPAAPSGTCTTYTNSTSTPITDAALTTSTINIPDSKIIRSLRATIDYTHANALDLDINLRSPADNNTTLINDNGIASQTGPQVYNLMDEAVIPVLFAVNNGILSKPIANRRLHWNRGENSQGAWNLDLRDDTAANVGTLNSWSLEVCEDAAPTGSVVYSENFESGAGGFTHTGTLDEWELGLPATLATTTANPIAAFNSCASGVNCWKTDLDGIYENSSVQDLTSPNIDLTTTTGPIKLYWQSRYQIETASFDRIWVRVTEVANPTNTRVVWLNDGATQTATVGTPVINVPASAGWGRYDADISDFAGKIVQVNFHVDSDTSVPLGGWAIDDVSIRGAGPVAAPTIVSGRVEGSGRGVGNALVTLTEQNGNKLYVRSSSYGYFEFPSVLNQQTITVSVSSNKRFTFTPFSGPLTTNAFVTFTGTPVP